jgi:hypothetical protein
MTLTEIVASVQALAAQAQGILLAMNGLMALLALAVGVTLWRQAQHDKAARRVRDRLAQEADPEGWARRQARQAHEAALIAEELAAMRRASWYGRLLRWRRHTDQAQT